MWRIPTGWFLLAAAVAAQPASVVPYGSGCGPTASWSGSPRLGQPVTFQYAGPNRYADIHGVSVMDRPTFLMGVSDLALGTVPLPLPIPPSLTNSVPGCMLLQSSDVVQPMGFAQPFPPTQYESQVTIPVPNAPALLGATVFVQWLHWHRDRPSYYVPYREWIALSAALRVTIGT